MAEFRKLQRENIGVDDENSKQKQFSPEHQKQHDSDRFSKKLSLEPEGKQNVEDQPVRESSSDKDKGDKELNPNKIAGAVEVGVAFQELAPATSIHAISVSHVASAVTAVTPVASALAAPLFGLF